MGSLLDVLRSGVKIVDQVTKPLQATLTYERFKQHSGDGRKYYYPPISLVGIVEGKQQQVRAREGQMSVSRAKITLLNVTDIANATGGAGINAYDKFTLPDGTTGPILSMDGFMDAGTAEPLATEIYIG